MENKAQEKLILITEKSLENIEIADHLPITDTHFDLFDKECKVVVDSNLPKYIWIDDQGCDGVQIGVSVQELKGFLGEFIEADFNGKIESEVCGDQINQQLKEEIKDEIN